MTVPDPPPAPVGDTPPGGRAPAHPPDPPLRAEDVPALIAKEIG